MPCVKKIFFFKNHSTLLCSRSILYFFLTVYLVVYGGGIYQIFIWSWCSCQFNFLFPPPPPPPFFSYSKSILEKYLFPCFLIPPMQCIYINFSFLVHNTIKCSIRKNISHSSGVFLQRFKGIVCLF